MAQLPCVFVYHGPLQIATFWGWLAIYFHYGVRMDLQVLGLGCDVDNKTIVCIKGFRK